MIDETEPEQIKSIKRQLQLQEQTDDYLTKLDLIDEHPELFDKRKDKIKLTKIELEQVRILIVGDRKLFASRSPRLTQLSKIKTQKVFNKARYEMPVIPEINNLLVEQNLADSRLLRRRNNIDHNLDNIQTVVVEALNRSIASKMEKEGFKID